MKTLAKNTARMNVFLNILILVGLSPTALSYNYLVFSPSFGHSHSTFMGKIADTLKGAGHNVTVLSLVLSNTFRHVEYTKLVKDVIYIETTPEIDEKFKMMESGDFSRFWVEEGNVLDTIPSYLEFMKIFEIVYDNLQNNTHVLDELKATHEKFDAITFESFMFMGRGVQEYLDIPVFLPVTSVTHDNLSAEKMGEPVSPSYLSGYFSNFGNVMSFRQRTINTISYFLGKRYLKFPKWKVLGDSNKDLEIEDYYYRAPYIFINSNPYIDFPRPVIQKTIQIGGISVDVEWLRSHTVDEKWSEILNRRPHNVLISFGTMFHSVYMPEDYKKNIARVAKSFPNVTFIWKYESDETSFASGVDNIVFSKWIPQTALLADSRLSAFLTHGGLGSVNELSYLGKPAILCPLFADQLRNANMLARHNGSIEISKFDLPNYSNLRSAIQRILHDESYKKNAERLSKRLEKQPIKPSELLLKHFEFAAEFGEQPGLDCHLRNMSFVEYYLLDVIALFVSSVLIVFVVVYLVSRQLFRTVKQKLE